MNEIRHINLGRQAYTIAADAYKELHDYLEAIGRKAGKEVADEVELRVAELLEERGITGDKVVLAKDVAYIKEQLGTPTDFSDDDDDAAEARQEGEKRLFRDTDNAMVAGVAAGLGKYFGIDPIIIRIIFVALTFAGATGIIVYILLWILVPEAKTKSDRLQMQGLPVNVDNIKEAIARADIEGAAHRASNAMAKAILRLIRIVLGIAGVGLLIAGLASLIAATTTVIYGLLQGAQVGNVTLFPVGAKEVALVLCGYAVAASIATMLITSGISMIRCKWRVPHWVTFGVVGVFFAAVSAGGALAADTIPRVRDRYEGLQHTTTQAIEAVSQIHFIGDNASYRITSSSSDKPSIDIRTLGSVNTKDIAITRDDKGVLTIDTTKYHVHTAGCRLFWPCFDNDTQITIRVPEAVPFDGTSGAAVELSMGDYEVRGVGDDGVTEAKPAPDVNVLNEQQAQMENLRQQERAQANSAR